MTRDDAISTINDLFPPDAIYIKSAEIGEALLKQAKEEIVGWRAEPTEVLIRFAQLCLAEENRQAG